jgi:hypothetical protein
MKNKKKTEKLEKKKKQAFCYSSKTHLKQDTALNLEQAQLLQALGSRVSIEHPGGKAAKKIDQKRKTP